jgi:FkbM family methyltransferase
MAGRFAGEGIFAYRNEHGHVMEADLSDYMERMGFFGAHSSRFVRYITSTLRPGDWAIDAGANVGLISSPMCSAVGPEGRVWTIEPLPRNVDRLRRLKEANGLTQMEIFPVALASKDSTERLRLSAAPGGSGWGSFVAPWAGEGYVEVPTQPLDELVAARGPDRPLRLLKIDVEGFEPELLAGARVTLSRTRPVVICEFHDDLLRATGSSSEKLVDAFAELGYFPQSPFGRPSHSLDGKVLDMLLIPQGV